MDIILYKEDLLEQSRHKRGEDVSLWDLPNYLCRAVGFSHKVTFMDGFIPFILKDKYRSE